MSAEQPETTSAPAEPSAAPATQPAVATESAAGTKDETPASTSPDEARAQADKLVAEGKKAIALKQWEEGVQKYAEALDLMRPIVGDFDPSMAPLLLSYGKALFEVAFSQSGVMGKEEVEKETQGQLDDQAGSSKLIESADPELLAADADADAPAEEEGEEEGGGEEEAPGEDEPEDDWNAAWEVLDVARTIYAKMVDEAAAGGEERKDAKKEAELRLGDCYLTLGDISCETENFPQAVSDYTSSLALLKPHHASTSRAISALHFQLGTALEFIPARRAEALTHVEAALQSFRDRLADLSRPAEQAESDEIRAMAPAKRDAEVTEVKELIVDLELKVEELKAAPERNDLVEEGIQHLLGSGAGMASGSGSGSGVDVKKDEGPVNDLSGMVKKKKKPTAPPAAPTASQASTSASASGPSMISPATSAVPNGVSAAAETVKEAVQGALEAAVDAAQKAVETVKDEAAAVVSNGAEKGEARAGEKRAANGDESKSSEGGDERSSKRVKAE